MANDVGHLSVCLFLICIYIWLNVCSKLLPIFIEYFLIIKHWKFFIYAGNKSFIRYMIFKYLLTIYGLFFHSLNRVFQRAEIFYFDVQQLINAFLNGSCILCHYLRKLCWTQVYKIFSYTLGILYSHLQSILTILCATWYDPKFICLYTDSYLFHHHLLKWLYVLIRTLISIIRGRVVYPQDLI